MLGITLDAFAVGYIFGKLIFWSFIIFVIVLIFRMIIRSSSSENNVLNNLQNTKKEENETITHSPTSEPKKEVLPIDLKHFEFVSDNHIRYNNGVKSDADNRGACRGILIESSNNEIFMVSIHNLKKENPIFGNIQMSPKAMKIVRQDKDSIELRGYGHDEIGASFSDYGMILHLSDNTIQKITLIMWDRNARIEYLKVEEENITSEKKEADKKLKPIWFDLVEPIKLFQNKWNSLNVQEQMSIAYRTDENNNIACKCFIDGNVDMAITYFTKALEIMPTNDDALLNLARCYSRINKQGEALKQLVKLFYLSPKSENIKDIITAYGIIYKFLRKSLSVLSGYELIFFLNFHLNINTNESDVARVINRINKAYNKPIISIDEKFGLLRKTVDYSIINNTNASALTEECRDILNWE